MTDGPPRYRDYQSSSMGQDALPRHAEGVQFLDSTVVMKTRDGSWHAIWQGEHSVLEEFDGTKHDAIRWARQRSTRCWVYSEERHDVVLVHPDDPDPV